MSIIGGNQNIQDGNIYLDGPQLNPGVLLNELGLDLSEANQLSQANANYGMSLEFLNAKIQQAKEMQSGLVATAQKSGLYRNDLSDGKLDETIPTAGAGVLPADGAVWPNHVSVVTNPDGSSYASFAGKGFLHPTLIKPTINDGISKPESISYEIKDWRGHILKGAPDSETQFRKLNTEERFKISRDLPKKPTDLKDNPYSQRDVPVIFGDYRQDYFRHGLQILDGIGNPIAGDDGNTKARFDTFRGTPWENNDPIMMGFDIVIDAVSSPLLNGSVIDFINQYSSVNEIAARRYVYEDFKNQFVKFFRTKGTVRVDDANTYMTRTPINTANLDSNASIFWPGKKAYLGYYIKKVGGLDLLSEANKGDTFKYLPEYRKDMITIDFNEDVTMSIGTLIHLYKLLYWSKPNGKTMIPENLLRFNCDIIISECRNFVRTRKDVESGNLEVLKDNLSRHVFQLRDCQFWFDKSVVSNDVDISQPSVFESHTVSIDFKYVTERFERFVPTGNLAGGTAQWGTYVGYNGGAIWKIGNAGERENRNLESGGTQKDSSLPKFLTIGNNPFNEEGVATPFLIRIVGNGPIDDEINVGEAPPTPPSLDAVKKNAEEAAAKTAKENETEALKNTLDETDKSNKKNKSKKRFDIKSIANKPGAGALQKALTSNTVGKLKNSVSKGAGDIMSSLQKGSLDDVKNAFKNGAKNQKDLLSEKSLLQSLGGVVKGSSQLKDYLVTKSINNSISGLKSGTADLKSDIALKKQQKEREKEASGNVKDKRQELLDKSVQKSTGTPTPVPSSVNDATKPQDQNQQIIDFLGGPLGGQILGNI